MAYRVYSPASCGEFIQGTAGGRPFLITCPINRYSLAVAGLAGPPPGFLPYLPEKSELVRCRTLEYVGGPPDVSVYLRRTVPVGKGMASSSADLSAVAAAVALACGRKLSLDEITRLLLSVEPSDATFYPGVVQLDHVEGRFLRPLGPVPAMALLIYDTGGQVDTVAFNRRPDLERLRTIREPRIAEAVELFVRSLARKDRAGIGAAATKSAFANQDILPKPGLAAFHRLGQRFGSYGTVVAHSGTVMALLFPPDFTAAPEYETCREAIHKELPFLSYLDTVEMANEGLQYYNG